jgi:tetratricopeptide (TPR) repeat protein
MKRLSVLLICFVCLAVSSHGIDFTALSAVKRLRAEKRYDEALKKLEVLATQTSESSENFSYLSQALDIAVDSLKDADRALALVDLVKEPALRDFAKLRVLADFQRYDEALAFVSDKKVESWPTRVLGQAHSILAVIYHEKKDTAAELAQWQLAASAPGAEVGVRGRALREAGVLFQKQGNAAKAEEQFREAIKVTPSNYAWRVESLISLSRLLIDSQRAKEAVNAFDGTDFTRVTNLTARGNLLEAYARTLLAAGKRIKAIETFDQLLQLNLPATWRERIDKELDQMAEEF